MEAEKGHAVRAIVHVVAERRLEAEASRPGAGLSVLFASELRTCHPWRTMLCTLSLRSKPGKVNKPQRVAPNAVSHEFRVVPNTHFFEA